MSVVALTTPGVVQAQTPAGTLTGQVVREADGKPVEGSTVRIGTAEAVTDEFGMFRFAALAAGRHGVRVFRLGYVELATELVLESGQAATVRLVVSEAAIRIAAVSAEAFSADSLRARGAGYARNVLTRVQLAQWESSALTFGDVLRTAFPSVRMRRLERLAGSEVCIELRSMRAINNQCLMPAVFLDGVPITHPTSFFSALGVNSVERVEIVPAAEAGVRFGTGALYGAILIESRRPGERAVAVAAEPPRMFDWSAEPRGHRTAAVLLAALAGNAGGAALGHAAASSCIHLRQPANDALQSDCDFLTTMSAGLAAVVLPSFAGGLLAGRAGRTPHSRGQLTPAVVGSAMLVIPGYALTMSGLRSDSEGLRWTGIGLITIGAPLAATAADYLFRKVRN